MEIASTQSCPKCLEVFNGSFTQHYESDCLQKTSISKLSEKVAMFVDQTYICGRCINIFTKDKWEYHQKKIRTQCSGFSQSNRKQFTPVKSIIGNEEVASERGHLQSSQKRLFSQSRQKSAERKQTSSVSQNRLFSTSFFSDRQTQSEKITLTKQITEDQTILLLLLNLLDAKSKIPLLDWVKRNRMINSIYLQQFFERFLEKTFNRLREVIKVPTFDMLEQKLALKWKSILKQPEDIFNQEIILESVKSLSSNKRNKVLKCLNNVYKSFYEDVFPKFNIEVIQPQKKRSELPLRTKDLFELLEQLFATKERDLIHIGIDLYLIFQSAQRITSDKVNITQGIKQLLIDRKNNPKLCELEMEIRKTRKSGKFILSQQLCQLLELFQWEGFYKNGKLYERMRKIFGFPVYSIKKCIFTEFELQKVKNQHVDLQKLANHGSLNVSLGYARDGVETNQKVIKDSLRIPNLRICPISREALIRFLGRRLHFRKHTRIHPDWLQRLKKKLHGYNKAECDYYDSEKRMEIDKNGKLMFEDSEENIPNQVEKLPQNQQMQNQLGEELEVERVKIGGLEYSFKEKKFKFHQLFIDATVTYCQSCDLEFSDSNEQGKICIHCTGHYHTKCLPKFCSCLQSNSIHFDRGVQSNCQRYNNQLMLKMPQEYLENKNQERLDQIIFLLAARKFRFTPTAVLSEEVRVDQEMVKKCNIDRITLTNFEDYQKGSYFPPLFLDVSGEKTSSGTGFGLFAAEDIPKHCFIGEYAADILAASDAIYIKRIDSVFTLIVGSRPSNTLLIGPFKHCGYVGLINGARPEEANCQSLKVEINGFVRVIVFTNKRIKQGVQLCYNYDEQSRFAKSGLLLKSQKPKQSLKIPHDFRRRGLVNLGSTCYMNATFQFLRILLGDCIEQKESAQVEQDLYQIMLELKRQEKVYNPTTYVNSILSTLNAGLTNTKDHFSVSKQADAHEFLIQILDKMNKNVKHMISGTAKSTRTCKKCQSSSTTDEVFETFSVQISEQLRFEDILHKEVSQNVEYDCEICSHLHHTKTIEVTKLPDILFISLKRFTSKLTKISDPIERIDAFQDYDLKAVIAHKGTSIANGHYIVEEYLQDFVCVLDDSKTECIPKDVHRSTGYIFGYKKRSQ